MQNALKNMFSSLSPKFLFKSALNNLQNIFFPRLASPKLRYKNKFRAKKCSSRIKFIFYPTKKYNWHKQTLCRRYGSIGHEAHGKFSMKSHRWRWARCVTDNVESSMVKC